MQWDQLISTIRFGQEHCPQYSHDLRTEFQRDYDRLIFSPVFRRLQNKTQVFPLPGSVFVHNRLTHSLEVSCVGRSIGNTVCRILSERHPQYSGQLSEIGSIVAAACLAHDLGNPPFGHSGEKAIATYFSEQRGSGISSSLTMTEAQWKDITTFEGNANAFRLLTHQFCGRRPGGFVLTYSTLASIVKYPYESLYSLPGKQKFGFFQSEKYAFYRMSAQLGIPALADDTNRFARYPLVYLVEAADDICYQMMDIEDAYKLNLLSFDETCDLFFQYLTPEKVDRARNNVFSFIADRNEQIAYLRSKVVGVMIDAVSSAFVDNEQAILDGTFHGSLIGAIEDSRLGEAYKLSSKTAVARIYNAQVVVDIELAGFKIISALLDILLDAVFHPDKAYSRQLLRRIPLQYDIYAPSDYNKVQSILDYISGMTDVYALDLYRKINGMSLPTL